MSDSTADAPQPFDPDQIAPAGRELLSLVAGLWWVPLLRGMMLIVLGGYALLTPGLTLVAFATVLGVFVLFDGVLAILAGAMGWVASRWWAIARGLLGVGAALFVLAHPALVGVVGVTTLVLLLAIQSIVAGVLEIVAAVRERNQIEGEWWLILGGVLSVVFGGILLSRPVLAGALLIQVLGAFAIVGGVALVVASLRLRSFGKRQQV
ncbi:acid-resistance membrane protein [Pseudobythopirellula maris]|uniref:Acid-resistance membrane protein n=1 Tax=Pseudobythopirellula maris TaxID=2527991 RepID=A0A5C5ZLD3_9BACT|nr:DUF308 domain-containing protein [Pseudobythopirellula maris]TWT87621.1 acid-resistance membrane protein [Pseudobythopirellula maris]